MKNKTEIEAKKIMDNFISALKDIPHDDFEYNVLRKNVMRKPRKKAIDKEFRDLILNNAPEIESGCIKAEKKKW
jgi:Asp-tRNA(Asn)/Glu-tRNA(Gln) amidotransferase C subunit